MTIMFDMNDAEPQKTSELIPDGTFAKVSMTIRPGGINGQSEIDQALLKAPKDPTSDVRMLDCEFTVVEGPHVKRKFWQMFTVQGGKVDENGVSIGWKISKSTFRAMIDSALGLDPQDMSEAAKQKRVLRGLADPTTSPSSPRSRSSQARIPATAIRTASIASCCRPTRNGSSSWTARTCRRARADHVAPAPRPPPRGRPGRNPMRKADSPPRREPSSHPARRPGRNRHPVGQHHRSLRVQLGSTGDR
jgi:hypothetical protein